MRRRLLLQALVIGLTCWVLPPVASAASPCSNGGTSQLFAFGGHETLLSDTSIPVCATGAVEVSFGGGPDAGRYSGTESWQPQGLGDLDVLTYRRHGRAVREASLVLGGFGGPVQSAVERSPATGGATACSDRSDQPVGGFFAPRVRGGRITLKLTEGEPLFGTRCAGPLQVDLGSALPAATLSVKRVVHGGLRVDLRGARRFSAHGFSGMVRSTLVLRLGHAKTKYPSHRSAGSPSGQSTRLVTVTYRVDRLQGSAVSEVSASPVAALCGPLDACGLGGTIGFLPGAARGGSVYLTAAAPARRPRRDFLAALGLGAGGNRAGIAVNGGGEAQLHGTVTADLVQGGACRDRARVHGAQLSLDVRGSRLRISLSPAQSQAADPLRTRCPGPELGQHTLTSSNGLRSVLRRQTFRVALHGGAWRDGPYEVRTRSTVMLTLRRVRVRTQTYRLPSPP